MQTSIKKIILATDFSDTSKEASHYALLLATVLNAELNALHVFDLGAWKSPSHYYLTTEGYRLAESQDEIRQRGKDALNKLAESIDLEVETIFTEGDPGHEIISVADELNADLIILGTHGYSGWKRFAIGSVAEFVTKHAPCAVLTIRPKGK
ncbi:MAG: universal stress protein [Nitrosomonadales bacterium]|jgi:universal stress protein A|nr:MAG: universal stress protein [Nitrosomonadales bacterium]